MAVSGANLLQVVGVDSVAGKGKGKGDRRIPGQVANRLARSGQLGFQLIGRQPGEVAMDSAVGSNRKTCIP